MRKSATKTIQIYNRRQKKLEPETLYKAGALLPLFGPGPGFFLGKMLAKSQWAQNAYAAIQEIADPSKRIARFVATFDIDLDEVDSPIESYRRFDDFFTRRLKSSARPVDPDPNVLIAPADCRLLFLPLNDIGTITVKGKHVALDRVLEDKQLAESFKDGTCVSCRLSPADYHWFHYIDDGYHQAIARIPGNYYPITPAFFQRVKSLYSENRRDVSVLHTGTFGTVAQVEIGGFIVGRIHQNHPEGAKMRRGDAKGYFAFGGSQILLFFQVGTVVPDPDVAEQSRGGIETLVRFGERIGRSGNTTR